MREIWPNLRVLFGGGVSADAVPARHPRAGGPRTTSPWSTRYNATEGGVYAHEPTSSGARGMLMLPHRGTFFEFVPLEEHESADAQARPALGGRARPPYAIVVTTVSGLYAYKLGDIVRFPSTHPLRIEFMGRLSGCLSVTQELTTHVEIERAVAHAIAKASRAARSTSAPRADVGVDGTAKSRYLLFVEFQEGAARATSTPSPPRSTRACAQQNRVYREHRTGEVALLAPRVVPLVARRRRAFLDEVTRGNVQGKFPRIIDDTKEEAARRASSRSRKA